MRNIYIYIVLNFFVVDVWSQEKNIQEHLFLHINNETLLVGETFYYSAFNNSMLTGKPSTLSAILYIELIGEDGPVVRQKAKLVNGRGNGGFFLPSTLPTGKYHLIAHTRWMKNFDDYFHQPITIINPFERYTPPKQPDTKLEIKLFPAGGKLVRGVENTVGYLVTPHSIGDVKGKVVDGSGNTVTNFSPGEQGFGSFIINPGPGDAYRVLLEDAKGIIHFFDLPEAVSDGATLTVQRTTTGIKATMKSLTIKQGKVLLSNSQEVFLERNIEEGTPVPFDVPSDKEGYYYLTLDDTKGNRLSEARIFIGEPSVVSSSLDGSYGKRSEINLPLELENGAYSVSVRKKTEYLTDVPSKAAFSSFWSGFGKSSPFEQSRMYGASNEAVNKALLLQVNNKSRDTGGQISYLPELRGQLIEVSATGADNKPKMEATLTMAFPVEPYQLRTALTDSMGKAVFEFHGPFGDTEAFFQTLNTETGTTISINDNWIGDKLEFDFQKPPLDSFQIREAIDRSVRVQIENAYLSGPITDTTFRVNEWYPQFGDYDTKYILDDYNRFPTVKDHFVEYILGARVRRNSFIINHHYPYNGFNNPHLVLVDGVPVEDSTILEFSPYKVKTIGLINNRFYLGPTVFDGVLNFETFEGGLGGMSPNEGTVIKNIKGISVPPRPNHPDYSLRDRSNIPDKRDQLYWLPDYRPDRDGDTINFYTSDNTGKHEIMIEGFTDEGKAVSRVVEFEVK